MVLHKEGIEPYRWFAGVVLHEVMHLVQPVISFNGGGKTGVYLRTESLFAYCWCRVVEELGLL